MEPFEFSSNSGGGVPILRCIKRREVAFYEFVKTDELVKSQKAPFFVIPAKAGISSRA